MIAQQYPGFSTWKFTSGFAPVENILNLVTYIKDLNG